ncbi:MAG: sodium ion-translocating decarboxylase subunit beta [Myxococcota bacterium]|nr:sodium ion-translocating decarboxylase subunit beta [Myxococcota bacterium]
MAERLLNSSGLSAIGWTHAIMIALGVLLVYLAVRKQFEPLLLLPIGFGAILSNIPLAGITEAGGLLSFFYMGISSGLFPPLIFLGIGALTDFAPMLANPKLIFLGAAAQVGIFVTLIGAIALGFDLKEAASIGIIGGADGPTAIYLTSFLAPELLGAIAVAAYSYMALVPIIQPPIMRALTSPKERAVKMKQMREVSQREKIVFPIACTIVCGLILPSSVPLIGMLMLGNLLRESGVVDRLLDTAQNALLNIVTIFLGLAVGSKMSADQFLRVETLKILALGVVAFGIGTAGGVIFGKLMCRLSGWTVNPLIGAAGVSAVPMAARVAHKLGLETDSQNHLLMHAMGPNVAGVLGSAIAAGVLLAILG